MKTSSLQFKCPRGLQFQVLRTAAVFCPVSLNRPSTSRSASQADRRSLHFLVESAGALRDG